MSIKQDIEAIREALSRLGHNTALITDVGELNRVALHSLTGCIAGADPTDDDNALLAAIGMSLDELREMYRAEVDAERADTLKTWGDDVPASSSLREFMRPTSVPVVPRGFQSDVGPDGFYTPEAMRRIEAEKILAASRKEEARQAGVNEVMTHISMGRWRRG